MKKAKKDDPYAAINGAMAGLISAISL
jgi:Mitochondrial carrier protein